MHGERWALWRRGEPRLYENIVKGLEASCDCGFFRLQSGGEVA